MIGRRVNIKLSKECEERPLRKLRYATFLGLNGAKSLQLAVTIADLRVDTEPRTVKIKAAVQSTRHVSIIQYYLPFTLL